MRTLKFGLFGAILLGSLSGTPFLTTSPSQAQQREERREERNYWRHHGGKWSHWDARDKRWYYTDGDHWYYHNGKAWELYRFDKTFGRENFERARYVVPEPGTTVVVPTHEVYVPR